jgi:hypothetical protein
MATSGSASKGAKTVAAKRKVATNLAPAKRPVASRGGAKPRAVRAPSLGHAGDTLKHGAADTLKQMRTIEAVIAKLARQTVGEALNAAGGAARELVAIVRDVLAGAVQAAETAGSELNVSIKGAARGTIAGVIDARGNVSRAASEIVKASIKQGNRVGAEIGAVARSALEGIDEGLAEAGQSATAIAKTSARDALATARDISSLAAQAVQQVLRGMAEGIDEVVKSHREAKAPAARRAPSRKAAAVRRAG